MATTTTTTSTQTPPVGATNTVYSRTTEKPNRTAFWVIGVLIVAAIAVWFASQNRAQQAVNYSNPTAAPVATESATGTNTNSMSDVNGAAALPADTGTTAKDVDKTPVPVTEPAE